MIQRQVHARRGRARNVHLVRSNVCHLSPQQNPQLLLRTPPFRNNDIGTCTIGAKLARCK